MMKYIKLVIAIADEYQEPLIAELSEMGFDGFQQHNDKLITYITKEDFGVGDRERIEQILTGFPDDSFIESEEITGDQNWNEQWEQTIRAQEVGPFFIKPTWDTKPVPEDKILLEIDPKMSFGTGYHETTRLILSILPRLIEPNDKVIDAGTGTGILSIASVKLGAAEAFAFDIDDWSIKNTRENILLNDVADRITVKQGSSKVIPPHTKADVLLANIERNVILELLPDFIDTLKKGGELVLSGLLETDRRDLVTQLEPAAKIINIQQENEWIAIHARITDDASID